MSSDWFQKILDYLTPAESCSWPFTEGLVRAHTDNSIGLGLVFQSSPSPVLTPLPGEQEPSPMGLQKQAKWLRLILSNGMWPSYDNQNVIGWASTIACDHQVTKVVAGKIRYHTPRCLSHYSLATGLPGKFLFYFWAGIEIKLEVSHMLASILLSYTPNPINTL